MTARESVKNYPSALREMTNYSVRGIKKICKETGAHPAGSEEEKKAQVVLKQELTDCCDEVKEESFKAKQNVSLFLILGVIALVAGIVLTVCEQFAVGGFFVGLGVVLIILPFILFKKVDAVNLYGIKKPLNAATKRIVFLANSDSKAKFEGAGDNLSGCYAALSVVRFLKRQELALNNTEIWVVLTDADKIDMCGTKNFLGAHKFDDMETVLVSLSCLVNPDAISVYFADDKAKNVIENAENKAEKKFAVIEKASEAKAVAATGAHFAKITGANKDDLKQDISAEKLNLRAIEAVVDVALETVFSLED